MQLNSQPLPSQCVSCLKGGWLFSSHYCALHHTQGLPVVSYYMTFDRAAVFIVSESILPSQKPLQSVSCLRGDLCMSRLTTGHCITPGASHTQGLPGVSYYMTFDRAAVFIVSESILPSQKPLQSVIVSCFRGDVCMSRPHYWALHPTRGIAHTGLAWSILFTWLLTGLQYQVHCIRKHFAFPETFAECELLERRSVYV